MKIALIIVGVLVLVVAIVIAIGAMLPREHVASRSARIARPPADVYAAIRDFESLPKWRADVQRVEMLGLADGHLRFREHASHGAVTYEVIEDVPPRKLVTRIADRDLGYSGSWTYELTPDGDGTELRITENGEVSNVVFRFMSRFVFGHTATMEKYLEALQKRAPVSS
jgi:uncharacterized protein YndB with AHSA1/START domain